MIIIYFIINILKYYILLVSVILLLLSLYNNCMFLADNWFGHFILRVKFYWLVKRNSLDNSLTFCKDWLLEFLPITSQLWPCNWEHQDRHTSLYTLFEAVVVGIAEVYSSSGPVQTSCGAGWETWKPLGRKMDSNKSFSRGEWELYKNWPPLKTLSCHGSSL